MRSDRGLVTRRGPGSAAAPAAAVAQQPGQDDGRSRYGHGGRRAEYPLFAATAAQSPCSQSRTYRRLLARRMSAPPPPSVTAAGVLPVTDGAATVSIPTARVSVAETLIGEACRQPQFAQSDVRHLGRMNA